MGVDRKAHFARPRAVMERLASRAPISEGSIAFMDSIVLGWVDKGKVVDGELKKAHLQDDAGEGGAADFGVGKLGTVFESFLAV